MAFGEIFGFGSQSQRAIWFILPAHGANHIIMITTVSKRTYYNNTHSFFIRIYFLRISRLKFAKFLEYLRIKPKAEILKKGIILC